MSEETVLKAEVNGKGHDSSWPAALLIGGGVLGLRRAVRGPAP